MRVALNDGETNVEKVKKAEDTESCRNNIRNTV